MPKSYLFITLDSCRYDTFEEAYAPNMKGIAPLYRAMAPGTNTFSSHVAMFVGFTPGIATLRESFINPKYGRIFKMVNGGYQGKGTEHIELSGRNIIDGFNRLDYKTIGTGAVGWFNPSTDTGRVLSQDFSEFYFPGNKHSVRSQLEWVYSRVADLHDQPVFLFMNIGETHVPYYFAGAPWSPSYNPCVPFGENNNADDCRTQQRSCLEFVDREMGELIEIFSGENILICGDHGDCWGEDGLWEHGIHHECVYAVPLIFSLHKG